MRPLHRDCSPWSILMAFAWLTVLLLPHKALAVNDIQQYVQDALTVRSGLPQNSVNAIVQTTDGYIWMATEEGVARYDGMRISVFDTKNHASLPDNYITSIAAGRNGELWIGSRFGLGSFRYGMYRHHPEVHGWINAILVDGSGTVWAGSMEGLYRVRGDQVRLFTARDGLPGENVSGLTLDRSGELWITTDHGLVSLARERFSHPIAGLGQQISAATRSSMGGLWIASEQGVIRWNHKTVRAWPLEDFCHSCTINSLQEDDQGHLWLGLDHDGIAIMKSDSIERYSTREGLPSNDISSLFIDAKQHIWIGMNEAGAVEWRHGLFRTIGAREGLSTSMVWSVLEAPDHSLWIGTEGHGLDHVFPDGRVQVFDDTAQAPRDSRTEHGLFAAQDGTIWAGSNAGRLLRIRDGKVTAFRDPADGDGRMLAILPAPDGDLWLGIHEKNGLVRFHQGHFTHYQIPGLINTMRLAPDGSLWIGTDKAGLVHWQGQVREVYSTSNGLLSNFCQSVLLDRDGVIWAGTSPGGLNRIQNGRITTYSIEQGLFDRTVGAIIEDDYGNLWMSCNKGIFRVAKSELNAYASHRIAAVHSIVYGMSDGLRSPEANFGGDPAAWKDSAGRILFPTVAGVVRIDPADSARDMTPPEPILDSILFRGTEYSPEGSLTFGPGSGDLEVRFAAPEFTAAKNVTYRYRLRPLDADWVFSGTRNAAYYTRLGPGNYRFEVQASLNGGPWSPRAATIAIRLKPHFWQTPWFYALEALLLVSAAIATLRFRTRFLVRRNAYLEHRVEQRTLELRKAVQAAEQAQDALRHLAERDSLTNIWNRRAIFDIASREYDNAISSSLSLCLIMADIDHFKAINDTYGHQRGDRVIQEVVERISSCLRPYDSIGRYGGEELLIVLPISNPEDAWQRAEDLRHAVCDPPLHFLSPALTVTCSFGIAIHSPDDQLEEVIHYADEALYQAKAEGRNRVCLANREAGMGASALGKA